jgi:anti-sigma factor RsiW
MSCTEIRPELVGYHFGESEPETRSAIEAHLLGCRECLREYLDLKRAVETAPDGERPSPEARDRLRRAVAAIVAPELEPRAWSWWERPAAFVFAGAMVLAALMFMQSVSTGAPEMPNSLEEPIEAPAP